MPTLTTFATPVWHMTLDDHEKIDAELMAHITEIRSSGNDEGRKRTNVGGWQSNNVDLARLPLFRGMLATFLGQVSKELDIRSDCNIAIDSCWINVNYRDSYNRTHTHPDCMISGCYYVKAPEGCGELVLTDPRPQTSCLLLPVNKLNRLTMTSMRTTPQAGLIVGFPSWMPHYVDSSETEGERISVAFNANFLPPRQ
jgi:uncharacterized protein (TIGR02466 family)